MFKLLVAAYASSSGPVRVLLRAILEVIRQTLLLFGDPPCHVNLRGIDIVLPVSHKLPIYVADYPHYDTLPVRVADYLRQRYGFLSMIDIGANVGDTILSCYKHVNDRFLAVEVNPAFIRYLQKNCEKIPDLILVEALCSAEDAGETLIGIEASDGTARTRKGGKGGIRAVQKTLDTIISENPGLMNFHFLKIDTDGSDFAVIAGAQKSIRKAKPIILMECDIFDNRNFVHDFSRTMEFFQSAGYETVLAYDNLGHLFQVFAVRDYESFKYALYYQSVSQFGYFDLLILESVHRAFIDMEKAHFSKVLLAEARKSAAMDSLSL